MQYSLKLYRITYLIEKHEVRMKDGCVQRRLGDDAP